MSETKALRHVVDMNRLSMGELGKRSDPLWEEAHQASAELDALENKLALLTNEVVQRREASKLVLDKFTYFDTTIAQLRTDLAEAIRVIEIYARRHGYTLATEQLLSRIKSKV